MNFWKCKQLCARAGTDPLCFLLTDVLGYLHRHFGLSQPFLLESELQVGSWQSGRTGGWKRSQRPGRATEWAFWDSLTNKRLPLSHKCLE